MAGLFQWRPDAVDNAARIARRCANFDLTQDLGYSSRTTPRQKGTRPRATWAHICHEAAERRYGRITPEVRQRLELELGLIQKHNLAGFFLVYRDIVLLAQQVAVDLGLSSPETPVEFDPPGRGRGSSVSMLVGYLLGISHIDPLHYNLSLERFLPDDELASVPDIDLDFPRNIREELILRVHEKYGWEQAALTGMISTYRIRGACGTWGWPWDCLRTRWTSWPSAWTSERGYRCESRCAFCPIFRTNRSPTVAAPHRACRPTGGFPRQLAQHPAV